jgi:hypothetical protein
MANDKKHRDKSDNEKYYRHTTSKTGKWRGKSITSYKKYHSPSHPIKHDEIFTVVLNGAQKGESQIVIREVYKRLLTDHRIKETVRGVL